MITRHLSTASALAILAAMAAAPACAQDAIIAFSASSGAAELSPIAPETPAEGPTAELDAIIVTGTRRADVRALESISPVDVISAERLASTGAPSLAESLGQIAPSINFLRYTGIGATAGVSSPQVRGLGPDQVLVLLNGHRRHASSQIHAKVGYGRGAQAVDWNTIPTAAIGRVELLRDGASAQYGSDAISGVLNVVLREARDGGGLSAQAGSNYHGGGDTYVLDGWKGFALPNDGFLTVSAGWNKIGDTGPSAYPDTRAQYFAGDPNAATADPNEVYPRQITPDFKEFNAVLNAQLPLTTALEAYGFATGGQRITEKTGVRRRPLDNQTVRALYPHGFTPYQRTTSDDYAATGGLTWDAGSRGQFDLSATYGRNKIGYRILETVNPSLGAASPTGFYNGAQINEQTNVDLDYVNDLQLFGDTPLTLSAGLTYRNEVYTIEAGEPLSYTQGGVRVTGGPGNGLIAQGETVGYAPFRPSDAGEFTRDVWGAYAGAEQTFSKLQLGLAGRYEHYSDFGDTTTGKVSARYDFTPALAIRATANTGFRAPSIGQLGWSATTVTWSTTTPGVYFDTRTVPVSNPLAQALGAPDLKAEKSTNYSLGLVWRPLPRASLTVDAYRIDVDDRITLTGNLTGINALTVPLGLPAGSALSFFTNALDTRTEGLDVVGGYRFDVAGGNLDLSLAVNLNKTDITGFAPTPAPLAGLGLTLVDREAQGLVRYASPESKIVLGANYSGARWDAALLVTRYGEFRRLHVSDPTRDVTFGDQTVVDLSLGYHVTDQVRVAVGARNLFDSFPDTDTITLANSLVSGGDQYSAYSPRGSSGGYYYVTASYGF